MVKDTFNKVEYLDIIRGGKTILNINADDVNGKKTRDLELFVGERLGEGIYQYAIKYESMPKKKTGKIRGVCLGVKKNNASEDDRKIERYNYNGSDDLIKSMKEIYGFKLDHYISTIKDLKDLIQELKKENSELKEKLLKIEADIDDPGSPGNTLADVIAPYLPNILTKLGIQI